MNILAAILPQILNPCLEKKYQLNQKFFLRFLLAYIHYKKMGLL